MRTALPTLLICLLTLPANAKYSGGTGAPNDPYQIATAADLIALGETPEDYDKHFILTADIDLDPNLPGRKVFDKAVIAPDTDPADDWFQGVPFTGVFDGNDRTISHLTIAGRDYVGLFGWLGPGATISNLALQAADVKGSGSYVAGLVGLNQGGSITVSYGTGTVGGAGWVGGLVGENHGSISASFSSATVRGEYSVGGLTGDNRGSLDTSRATGAVSGEYAVGGLVGYNYGSIAASYSAGAVNGYWSVGGLAGNNRGGIATSYSNGSMDAVRYVGGLVGNNSYGSITASYSTGAVSGHTDAGGLVGYHEHGSTTVSFWDRQTSGQATSAGGESKATAEMQTASTFLQAGWDFADETANGMDDTWRIDEGKEYPRLWWQKYGGGNGTRNDPYQIWTAEQLNTIGTQPNDWDKHFKLMADIDLAELGPVSFNMIGADSSYGRPFSGVFDGDGKTITNLTCSRSGDTSLGLFADVQGQDALIKNVRLKGASVNVGTGGAVGPLVGYLHSGQISSCHVEAGSASGAWGVGGLAGMCSGTLVNCSSSASVFVSDISGGGLAGENTRAGNIVKCFSAGRVSARSYAGGIAGQNNGTVSDCYSITQASATKGGAGGITTLNYGIVRNCYSTGKVSAPQIVGGLVGGLRGEGSVVDSFWDKQTSGQATSAGGTGKTTAEMQTGETFLDTGWDFVGETANGADDIWWINEGKDYPRLWWEPTTNQSP